jgi:hypothetical protein
MNQGFYKQVYNTMQKISHDWKLTLSMTRSFVDNQKDDYYKPMGCTGLIISRGFIGGANISSLVTLPNPSTREETLSLIILERFKAMEASDELPGQRFLFSYIKDVQELYSLQFGKDIGLDNMMQILVSKSEDYGQAFRNSGYPGIKFRIWEKISRYFSMSAKNISSDYEPLEDTLKDITGYLIILLALNLE